IFGEQKETEETLWIRDKEVNKFCMYLQRAIHKMSYLDPNREKIIFTYSYALEVIGDEVGRSWRTSIVGGIERSKELKKMMGMCYEALLKSFHMYYHFKIQDLKDVFELRHQVRRLSLKAPCPNNETQTFIRRIVNIIEQIADLRHLSLMKKL
ncbi:hypothetical protein ACFL2V_14825, partial [Pseudomonadota bacterium]